MKMHGATHIKMESQLNDILDELSSSQLIIKLSLNEVGCDERTSASDTWSIVKRNGFQYKVRKRGECVESSRESVNHIVVK
jgi:hypothetical protein